MEYSIFILLMVVAIGFFFWLIRMSSVAVSARNSAKSSSINSKRGIIQSPITSRDKIAIDKDEQILTLQFKESVISIPVTEIRSMEYTPILSLDVVSIIYGLFPISYMVEFYTNDKSYIAQNVKLNNFKSIHSLFKGSNIFMRRKLMLFGRVRINGIPIATTWSSAGKLVYLTLLIAVFIVIAMRVFGIL